MTKKQLSGDVRVLGAGENWMRIMSIVATELSGPNGCLADGSTISIVSGNNAGQFCLDGPRLVAEGHFDLGITTPAWYLKAAIDGCGPFSEPLPLRAVGVFPHDDRLALAVRRELGITSLDDVKARQFPLRIAVPLPLDGHSVGWVVEEVLTQYGISLEDLERWGGSLMGTHPGSADISGSDGTDPGFDAIFDEAIMTERWRRASDSFDLRYLSLSDSVLAHCESLGMNRGILSAGRLRGLETDVQGIDFSGWALAIHERASDELGYCAAAAVAHRVEEISSRFAGTFAGLTEQLTIRSFIDTDLPLHAGAQRYYRECGYL